MLYAISWFLVLALLAVWSTCIWVLHAIASWSLTGLGAVVGQTQEIHRLPLPGWISEWLPPELLLTLKTVMATVLPWVESALSALPPVGNWLSPLAWTVWGVGFVILAVSAALLHAVIYWARRPAVG